MKSLSCRRASTSFSKALWATPEIVVCVLAPPSSSKVTSSLVTDYLNISSISIKFDNDLVIHVCKHAFYLDYIRPSNKEI